MSKVVQPAHRTSRRLVAASVVVLTAAALSLVGFTTARAEGRNRSTVGEGIRIEHGADIAFLGIHMAGRSRAGGDGVRIARVMSDSAAESAGLRRGDRIVSLDRVTVEDRESLNEAMREFAPGDRVSITVVREGAEQSFDVELGDRGDGVHIVLDGRYTVHSPNFRGTVQGTMHFDEADRDALDETYVCRGESCRFSFDDPRWYKIDCVDDGCPTFAVNFFDRPMLGIQVVQTTPELREHFGGGVDAGVLVSKVFEGSPAEAAGIQVGDLILTAGDRLTRGSAELRQALDDLESTTLVLELSRDGRKQALDVKMPRIEKR
jgi:predicted metalloprotease with PDZ domain